VALGGRFFGKEVKVIIIENEEKKEFWHLLKKLIIKAVYTFYISNINNNERRD
jgi:hypothetical protein